MIWKLRYFSFQKQTELAEGSPMALAAAEPHTAAAPETAGLCASGTAQGKGARWASSALPLAIVQWLPYNNAAAYFLLVCKKINFVSSFKGLSVFNSII